MKSAKTSQKILTAVVASLLFVCGFVFAYFLINTNREASAFNSTYTESDNAVIVGELCNVSADHKSGSFNGANIHTLIKMLSNNANGTLDTISTNINNATANNQGIKMINATNLRGYTNAGNVENKSIVVTLGGFKWIVTCLSKDSSGNVVATLWLDDAPSTKSTFGNSSSYWGSDDFSTNIPTGMYGASYMRAVVLNNGGAYANITSYGNPTATINATSSIGHAYGAFTHSTGALYPYIVNPNQMPYQTTSQGTNNGTGRTLNNESLATNLSGYYSGTFQTKSGYTRWGTDKLWLPSLSETGFWSPDTGIWQTSQAERSNSVDAAWSRSCSVSHSCTIYVLYSSGDSSNAYDVHSSNAVRPALHLNLTKVVSELLIDVVLDQQGGSGGTPTISCKQGEAMPSITVPTRTGYAFGGYYTGTNGSGDQYYGASGASLKNFSSTTPTKLYAKWTLSTYTIAYNGNGATGGSTASSSHTYNTAKALTTNGYTKTGYTFAGWATTAAGAVAYQNGASVKNLSSTNGATVILYAKWTLSTYTIAYNGNGATGGSTASSSHTYNTAKALTANGYTKTGYTFAGWATTAAGAVAYQNGASVKNLSSTNGATVTLYAKWTPITYTIAYNGNGATGGSTASSSHTYDTAKALTANGYTKTGYTFAGWATSASEAVVYSNSLSVTNLANTNGATVILYAKWTVNNYTVTLNYNGATGGNTTANKTVTFDSAYGVLPTPTKSGASFLGWYLESNFTTQVTSTTVVSITSNHTLYAKWVTWVQIFATGESTEYDYYAKLDEEGNSAKITITPKTNYYVSEFSLDNENFYQSKYCSQVIGSTAYGYASCIFDKNSNKITFSFDYIDLQYIKQNLITIYIKISSGNNSALNDGVGQVNGINVTATYGGKVSLLGDDFENLAETDTVTFVADVCVDGYAFSHWENSAGANLGTDNSIRLEKSVVMDNIIKAVFVAVDNSHANLGTDNQKQ